MASQGHTASEGQNEARMQDLEFLFCSAVPPSSSVGSRKTGPGTAAKTQMGISTLGQRAVRKGTDGLVD